MPNYVKIRMKVFTVEAFNPENNRDELFVLPMTLEQLRTAHDIGITTEDLLTKLLAQDGLTFKQRVGKPRRRNVRIDLVDLFQKSEAERQPHYTGNVWMKQRVCDLDGYDPEGEAEL